MFELAALSLIQAHFFLHFFAAFLLLSDPAVRKQLASLSRASLSVTLSGFCSREAFRTPGREQNGEGNKEFEWTTFFRWCNVECPPRVSSVLVLYCSLRRHRRNIESERDALEEREEGSSDKSERLGAEKRPLRPVSTPMLVFRPHSFRPPLPPPFLSFSFPFPFLSPPCSPPSKK